MTCRHKKAVQCQCWADIWHILRKMPSAYSRERGHTAGDVSHCIQSSGCELVACLIHFAGQNSQNLGVCLFWGVVVFCHKTQNELELKSIPCSPHKRGMLHAGFCMLEQESHVLMFPSVEDCGRTHHCHRRHVSEPLGMPEPAAFVAARLSSLGSM